MRALGAAAGVVGAAGRRRIHARKLKKQITIRLHEPTIEYSKRIAGELSIPYQTLINLYLRELCELRADAGAVVGLGPARLTERRWPLRLLATALHCQRFEALLRWGAALRASAGCSAS